MLNDFVKLWQMSPKVHDLKALDSEEYKMFVQKIGHPVALTSSKKYLDYMPLCKDLYDFYKHDVFWMIPCDLVSGKITGFVFRSFQGKDYRIFKETNTPQLMYGWQTFSGFRPGRPVVLTEGAKDAIAIAKHYPFVLSVLSSGVSLKGYEILLRLTNKFVLAFDSDEIGMKSAEKVRKKLVKSNCRVTSALPYHHDWAEGSLGKVSPSFDRLAVQTALKTLGVSI